MTSATDDLFEPLSETEAAASENVTTPTDAWEPIVPAPMDCPPSDAPRHPQHGEASHTWQYRDRNGNVLFLVCRFDPPGGNKKIVPYTYGRRNGRLGWHWKASTAPRALYGLDRLAALPDVPVIVCEGEKAADAAEAMFPDVVAVTSPNGAGAAAKADWAPLADREVIVWPDNDADGKNYAETVAELVMAVGAKSVSIVPIPLAFPEKWDLADPLPDGYKLEILEVLLYGAKPRTKPTAGQAKEREAVDAGPGLAFRLSDKGVEKKDGTEWRWFCSPLKIVAETRNAEGKDWGRLLAVRTREGQWHEWAMPMELLAGDGSVYRSELLRLGLELAPGKFARDALHEYISTARPRDRGRCVSRVGWHGQRFVLPDGTIGDTAGERVLLQTTVMADHAFQVAGRLEDWQSHVARYAAGNSRLIVAISAAFAGPLLHLLGAENGGLHFRGHSSTGKTTTLVVAGSVWGGGGIKGFVRQWRATDNGLEAVAAGHCDTLLCLDELSQVDPKVAGQVVYMLSNGAGKQRAGRSGEGRPPAQWRLTFLSSGEISLADKVAEDNRGRKASAGQEVRVIDIPADAGKGLGVFEDLHQLPSGDAFAVAVQKAAHVYYGTAGRAFLTAVTRDIDEVIASVRGCRNEFVAEHCSPGADGQVLRVAARFGLFAAAGELATAYGILPWERSAAINAASACFGAWLAARGGVAPAEITAGIAQVQRFIEQHGDSRFALWGENISSGDSGRVIVNRAGFRKPTGDGGSTYYVLPQVWRFEICAGFDARAIAQALVARGMMLKGKDGKPQTPQRLPGFGKSAVRCYVITAKLFDGGDDA